MTRGVQGRTPTTVTTTHDLVLEPARAVRGVLRVPGDKSISHRYALLGALAHGLTRITNLSSGADVAATIAALEALGVVVTRRGPHEVEVHGRGLEAFVPPAGPIDAANSGTTMRLLAGVLAGAPFATTLVGDASLSRRPMRRVLDPIAAMGARVTSDDGRPPIEITGGSLRAIDWRMPLPSAQVKSAVLIAGLAATGTTRVHEPAATRDHTERAFPAFGLQAAIDGLSIAVEGGQRGRAPSSPLRVPGDPSSAAIWAAAAAALPGSEIEITGVGLNPRRLGFLDVLRRMGARVEIELDDESAGEPVGSIRVAHDGHRPATIAPAEVPGVIDELPALAARAALGAGLEVSGAGELRVKESDRITALVDGLRALGVRAEERADGFVIDGSATPTGGRADAVGDHRLVMTFALVALGARGRSVVANADAVAVSYPSFPADLARLVSR
jgi:3-phosphoshikimate 1-carboxyvinyltransferase